MCNYKIISSTLSKVTPYCFKSADSLQEDCMFMVVLIYAEKITS